MNSPESELRSWRARAAVRSGGFSSALLYETAERIIASMDLRGAILDYGAGAGNLTRRLIALGRFDSVSAADIMSKPDGLETVNWIEQDLNGPMPDYDSTFDVVIAAGVIEYLENPRFMMREIRRVLRPGGTAIVTTPNHESWRSLASLVLRGHYAAFGALTYPGAITAVLRKDFTRIFEESGLSAPTFYFNDRGGIPGKPALTWQKISFGLLRGLRFSDDLLAVATKPAR